MFLKKNFLLIIIALILAFIFFYKHNNKSDTQIGGDFELTNHLGQKTTNNSFIFKDKESSTVSEPLR